MGRGLINTGPRGNGKAPKISNQESTEEQICVLKRLLVQCLPGQVTQVQGGAIDLTKFNRSGYSNIKCEYSIAWCPTHSKCSVMLAMVFIALDWPLMWTVAAVEFEVS